ncbi:hypothetical protein [Winogradskyella sp.]|uniref:hypothetical protein n=1 Tax=Winogradskyella sp. TaxID=1883156 RepID=UPI001B125E70|nr:hypothetical protein [Winogradskyella sp.]MBO6881446.1 hypothetical protein [Winogradskyella sp.]
MKKINVLLILLATITINLSAQEAPTSGKKILDVKESHEGEYMQKVTKGDLSTNVVNALKKRLPKKLKKYGFEDITITEVGKVLTPVSTATKMSKSVGGNKGAGDAQLQEAETSSEIKTAVDKKYKENVDNDWKFQVNFIDNTTKKEFKVRLSLSYNPQYIIKESELIVDLRG